MTPPAPACTITGQTALPSTSDCLHSRQWAAQGTCIAPGASQPSALPAPPALAAAPECRGAQAAVCRAAHQFLAICALKPHTRPARAGAGAAMHRLHRPAPCAAISLRVESGAAAVAPALLSQGAGLPVRSARLAQVAAVGRGSAGKVGGAAAAPGEGTEARPSGSALVQLPLAPQLTNPQPWGTASEIARRVADGPCAATRPLYLQRSFQVPVAVCSRS